MGIRIFVKRFDRTQQIDRAEISLHLLDKPGHDLIHAANVDFLFMMDHGILRFKFMRFLTCQET